MKNILCFGDSNTYGLKPDGTGRYDFSVRYPGRLQALLGEGYHIIEEGCPGRTTVFEDKTRPFKKGIDYFIPCIQSHTPLDWIIIMLGTNDCKAAYRASPQEIAAGLTRLIETATINEKPNPKLLLVAPAHLGDTVWQPEFDPEFDEESVKVSRLLAAEYKALALKHGCAFLDASAVTAVSEIDAEHLDDIGHCALANAVAEILKNG